MSVMAPKNKPKTTNRTFLKKGGKKARRKTLVVLREWSKQLTGKKQNYNGTFFKKGCKNGRGKTLVVPVERSKQVTGQNQK